MRSTDTKQTHYSMLLICEGTHTEPNFLALMIEDFKETGIIDFATTIKPKPTRFKSRQREEKKTLA